MNIKKEVIERIVEALLNERNKIESKINRNRYEFKKLTYEQTIMKREKVQLDNLIRELKKSLCL
ncbi:unnamed protein product, partial [marine sediment metagenome]